MQYYQYEWDNESFKIDEHTWLKYVGAYKNLISKEGEKPEGEPVTPLLGKTKLSGTQVIDANHILNLIDGKVKRDNGVQTVDRETLRLIYEEIQELSNMGEDEQAKLLREFVETELVPGNLASNLSFDESFNNWKQDKMKEEIKNFSKIWGIDKSILSKSLEYFSISKKEDIPYIDELQKNIDFESATNSETNNQLEHTMVLLNKALPKWLIDVKVKYR